jgi:hypothetical protein
MEIWKEIADFEGLYEVSNTGKIRSLKRNIIFKDRIDKYGYKKATLQNCGEIKHFTIHRLVAIAFIPNINNYPQINHKDGDKLNNNVSNLEWCTGKQNQRHAVNLGLRNVDHLIVISRTKKRSLNPNSKKVRQLTLSGEPIQDWECILDAAELLNINKSNISTCLIGRQKTAGGFKWAYI